MLSFRRSRRFLCAIVICTILVIALNGLLNINIHISKYDKNIRYFVDSDNTHRIVNGRDNSNEFNNEQTSKIPSSIQDGKKDNFDVNKQIPFNQWSEDSIAENRNILTSISQSNEKIMENDDESVEYIQNMRRNKETLNEFEIPLFDETIFRIYNDEGKTSTLQREEMEVKFPITPTDAIRTFGKYLSSWEQNEIFSYSNIWYLGLDANKTQSHPTAYDNYGFDYSSGAKKGHYKLAIRDHIAYRYEIVKELGMGLQGIVVEAIDHSNNESVALKIVTGNMKSEIYFHRELEIMKFIEANATDLDYFTHLIDYFRFRNHWCLVLELMGPSIGLGAIEDADVMRRYTNDTFHGLYYLHNLNILHSDVKPENIMYIRGKTNQSEGQLLKLVDFGMSCIPGSTDHKCGDYYLQPRFYRSPESILCLPVTTKCDIFSVGVLLVEFIIGFPPFMGNNEVAQLAAMMQVLGFPPSHLIDISQRKEVFAAALDFTILNGFHQNPYLRNLNELLEGLNPLLIDLITRCLKWDPKVRITAEEALRHPYLTIN